MKIALKELRETRVNLRIIKNKPIIVDEKIAIAFGEVNEPVAIFTSGIETAKNNLNKK